ncbi:MAG: cobyrinate a,c-diamide synthase [Clostridia bacterium]|nr:cobyrinate a,c-diamide synthase [Clostridia bacterium]
MNNPRVLIAGTSSGCGKTTAVCTILALLKRRNIDVRALKCGPDYLDPTFHETVTGIPCANLDPFFCEGDLLRYLLHENAGGRLTIIEGVMGYYDGTGESGTDNSSFTVADRTQTPSVLVIDAKGASASLLATLGGFLNYTDDSHIAGVLFSRMTAMNYANVKRLINNRFGAKIVPLGYIPELPEECRIPSRHLGLVSAQEITDITERIDKIADICENTLDIDGLAAIADSAEELKFTVPDIPKYPPVRIAIAKDRAFFFYYRDTLRLFERMGAEFCEFSPLEDEPLPEGCAGLFLGGGYPELYTDRLEKNTLTKDSIAAAIRSGMPVIAECGGFQYLGKKLDGRSMCGVLPHESANAGKLVRFGYITLHANAGGVLGPAGTVLRGHEFHYYDSTENGSSFTAVKQSGKQWDCAVMTDTMYAGYPHLYLWSAIPSAEAFYKKCLDYGRRNE